MLNLHFREGEYFTINGNIVIKIRAIEGNHLYLSVDAPREIPVMRGAVLEREGGERPACVDALPPRKKSKKVSSD